MGCVLSSALKYNGVNKKGYHTKIADGLQTLNIFNIFSQPLIPLCAISFPPLCVVIIWAIKILSRYHYVTVTFTIWAQHNLICTASALLNVCFTEICTRHCLTLTLIRLCQKHTL